MTSMKTYLLRYWPALCTGMTTVGILSPLFALGSIYIACCIMVVFAAAYFAQRLWNYYGCVTNHGMMGLCVFALIGYGQLLGTLVNSKLQHALFQANLMGMMLLLAAILWLANNWQIISWRRLNLPKDANGKVEIWQFWPAIAGAGITAPTVFQLTAASWYVAIPIALLVIVVAGYLAQVAKMIYGKYYFSIMVVLFLMVNQYGHLLNDLSRGKSEQGLTTAMFLGLYMLLLPAAWLEAVVKDQERRNFSAQSII